MTLRLTCWTLLGLLLALPCHAGVIEAVSVSSTGEPANGLCQRTVVGADGRFAAYTSRATNLVTHETYDGDDAYVRDRLAGLTYCASVTPTGGAANSASWAEGISDDGRYLVLSSYASNLVAGDTNGTNDLFVRDMIDGTTELVSISPAGTQWDDPNAALYSAHISGDGRYVSFYRRVGLTDIVYRRDRETGITELLFDPGYSHQGDLSDDSRFLAFWANVDGVLPGDTNGVGDVFLLDRDSDTIEWVSVSTTGEPGNGRSKSASVSNDGRYVAFVSEATNLVPDDTNGTSDVFLRDLLLGTTERVSVGPAGEESDQDSYYPELSRDGRFVLFTSTGTFAPGAWGEGIITVYVRDRETGAMEAISVGYNTVWGADLSPDGRFVVFTSDGLLALATRSSEVAAAYLCDRAGFADVGVDHWAVDAIAACVQAGVVHGYPDGLYRPAQRVERDQMAVYITRGLVGMSVPVGPAEPTFPDVAPDYWAYSYIEYVAAADIVGGYPNGYYRPEYDVDRGQMAVYVARAKGWVGITDDMTTAPELFPDVPAGFWAGTAVEACVDNGVVQGYGDGLYRPEAAVTRDQMAVYVARAFDLIP